MNRMRNWLGRAAAVALIGAGAGGPLSVPAADDIVVGAAIPITGPLSMSGRQYYDSLQMAQDDINSAGGIGGRKLKVVFEDTQASNSTAVNAFVKLHEGVKPSLAFLSSYSTHAMATLPEVAKAQIPVFYAGGADMVAEQNNKWMFRIRPYDGVAAIAMAHFVKDGLKKSKPGILYIQNDFGQGATNVAVVQFKREGLTVVGMEAYGQNDKDMSAQILSLKNKGADVLLAFVYPTDGALLVQQIEQLGVEAPLVASSGLFLPAALNLLSPKDFDNVWGVVDGVLDAEKSERVRDFASRYKKRFKRDADPYAASYYDALIIAAEGMRKVGTDPVKLRDYIASVKNHVGIGHVYTFDSIGNGVHDVAVIKAKPGTKDFGLVEVIKQPPRG
jgi:branched-chain amino acid transport system substrate-binding protein